MVNVYKKKIIALSFFFSQVWIHKNTNLVISLDCLTQYFQDNLINAKIVAIFYYPSLYSSIACI